jgi:hypothetical protein
MPRPPAELRRLEDEERRRARAHRCLRWERRRRVAFWLAAGLVLLGVVVFLTHLTGFRLG